MKRIVSTFLVIIMISAAFVLSSSTASASETSNKATGSTSGTTGDCTWTFDDSTGTLTISGNGNMADNYLIYDGEEEFDDGSVFIGEETWVSPWSSFGNNICKVVIDNGVKSIGNYAFYGCYNLNSLTIPYSVNTIGDYAFYDCQKLESVNIPNSVKSIGDYTFNNCSFESIIVPNGVEFLGENAFSSCDKLKSVSIPKSVNNIKGSPFCYCSSLKSITVDDDNTSYTSIDGILFTKDKKEIIQYCIGKNDTSITIPKGVISIGTDSFGFAKLRRIVIQSGVTNIGDYAFGCCEDLEEVTIPKSVTYIGVRAFFKSGYETDNEFFVKDIEDVYYGGTRADWKKIKIKAGNDALTSAYIHFKTMNQKITAKSYTKAYGDKAFSLKAKTSGNGKLSYKSSNKKVATVSSKGKVTIKGAGKATITIKASATSKYKAASKKITITVKPGKVKLKRKKVIFENGVRKVKQSFVQQKYCDGYKVVVTFKNRSKLTETHSTQYPKSRKDVKITVIKGLKYNLKICAYKKIGKKTYYGKWSKTSFKA